MGARRVVLDFLWKTTPKLKVMSWLDWEVNQRLEAVFIYLFHPPISRVTFDGEQLVRI